MAADQTGAALSLAAARLDRWLETLRGPGGYGGPVVHWWQQSMLHAGPGRDWRYEGIIDGYLRLWERSGDGAWLAKARRAGDDLLAGQLPGGNFAASGFELNPVSAGTPHEAACDVGLLLLARSLKAAGDESHEAYLRAARANLEQFYLGKLWDPAAQTLRDGTAGFSFVPNKAACACEALFLLAELTGDSRWAERYALPTLRHLLGYQVREAGRLRGAIAQNQIGGRRIEKYFPIYVARCVPALVRGYEWGGEDALLAAALAAGRFLADWTDADGALPTAIYADGGANRWPAWIAPLGDVARAADALRPHGGDLLAGPAIGRLLAGQSELGGIDTARGFAAQAGGRVPALPDVRDLIHVAGWCDKAFRVLAARWEGAPPPLPPAERAAECLFRGRRLELRETAARLTIRQGRKIVYDWEKGAPWPTVAAPAFWLR